MAIKIKSVKWKTVFTTSDYEQTKLYLDTYLEKGFEGRVKKHKGGFKAQIKIANESARDKFNFTRKK